MRGLIAAAVLAATLPATAKFTVERIDPPHWWVGMKNPQLQLQVHGKDVRPADFSVDYPGVTLDSVARLDGSPDWQFVYLTVSPDTKPGNATLTWREGSRKVSRKFDLLPRRTKTGAQGVGQQDVLYMVMPDRFADGNPANNVVREMNYPVQPDRSNPNVRHGGDLKGVMDHLDYIDSLGVTAVWLNPVLENDMPDGSYHGYATTDYYKVDRRFGSNAEYVALIDSLHGRGMKMVMDMIFNHSGSAHPWMAAPPSSDWFNFGGEFTPTNHKLSTVTDPYASDYDRDRCVNGWFVETMPDLNQHNPHLMRYLMQNSIFWIEEAGIDAIRMDTYPYADKGEMKRWVEAVEAEYPGFTVIGECWFADPAIDAAWQRNSPFAPVLGDSGLPVVMDFPLMMLSRDLAPYREQTDAWNGLSKIYAHLAQDFIYADTSKLLRFLDNHDTERMMLNEPEDLGAWKQAVTLLLTVPGIPQVYYGTELLMAGDRKPGDGNVRRDVPGGFPGDTADNFSASGRSALQNEAYDFMSTLLQWRRGSEAVARGSMKHFLPSDGLYVYERRAPGGEQAIVMMNGRDEQIDVDLDRFSEAVAPGEYRDILTGNRVTLGDSRIFAPREILILEKL